ncbi:DUF2285 domain-containing protein [Roseovarius sp. C03]|uniref:DUF2285 domain-containing protein n=1 Tax=Roseovarius sp. C03 TaxID=3449222 RepID=UPI003EDCA6EC
MDPDLAAPEAPVFWNAADAPAVVNLIAPLPPVGIDSATVAQFEPDGQAEDNGLSRLLLRSGSVLVGRLDDEIAPQIGVLIPFDDDWPIRIAAAERLRSELIERTADPPLTRQRRERLKRALRCVDARETGASYRAMATVLFGARRVADEPWKTSSLKAQVARLTIHGRMLVDSGYRRLLRGRPF